MEEEAAPTNGGGRRWRPGNAPAETGMRGAGAVVGEAGRRGAIEGEASGSRRRGVHGVVAREVGARGAGAVGASTAPSRGRQGCTSPARGIGDPK
jgi:hypothetical protein